MRAKGRTYLDETHSPCSSDELSVVLDDVQERLQSSGVGRQGEESESESHGCEG